MAILTRINVALVVSGGTWWCGWLGELWRGLWVAQRRRTRLLRRLGVAGRSLRQPGVGAGDGRHAATLPEIFTWIFGFKTKNIYRQRVCLGVDTRPRKRGSSLKWRAPWQRCVALKYILPWNIFTPNWLFPPELAGNPGAGAGARAGSRASPCPACRPRPSRHHPPGL